MIIAVKNFNNHTSEIKNDLVAYQFENEISTKLNYGYETTFAAIDWNQKGKLSKEGLNKYLGMSLIAGSFSYVEIMRYYKKMFGVSGTLNAMNEN